MDKIYYVIEKDIPKIANNKLKKIIVYDGNNEKWAIKDSYNNLTPFFTNETDIIVKNKNYCIFVGENEDGKYLYFASSANSRQSTIYGKVDNIKNIYKIENLERDFQNILVYNNDNQVCLFDITTFEQKSDYFKRLYYSDYKLLFVKEVQVFDEVREYYGLVDESGKISRFIYDNYLDSYKKTPLLKKQEKYDIIDEEILKEEIKRTKIVEKSEEKIKKLIKTK